MNAKTLKTTQLKANIDSWISELRENEKAENTLKAYKRSIDAFIRYLEDEENNITEINRQTILDYKEFLINQKEKGMIKSSTVNARITTLNKYFSEHGFEEFKVKTIKIQTSTTRNNCLTESDYKRLIRWAKRLNMKREEMLMKTLAGTGIRVNELKYFTVDNLKKAKKDDSITVFNKGKQREIIIPDRLRKELLDYARENNIKGIIFHAIRDEAKPLNKSIIWKNLKYIAGRARVNKAHTKPHNFRRLFAKRFIALNGENLTLLADLLGHSNLNTTRLYTQDNSKGQKKIVNTMNEEYD